MKRIEKAVHPAILFALCWMLWINAAPLFSQGTARQAEHIMMVQLERTALRAGPGFSYPVLAFLPYRTVFHVVRIDRDWIFGYAQGQRHPGYLHVNALVSAEIRSPGMTTDIPPLEASDIVMAGKGMYSSLEMLGERLDSVLDFNILDRLEQFSWPASECIAYLSGAEPSQGEW
ncbi:MAG: hypothetical protein N3A02_00585 [Rectinema sp.]|nr:hypothetical protein [Rectinema sp.]